MRCEGKLAVVTGSGGSMGGAIALRLAKEGADVVVNDRVAGRTDGIERDIRAMSRDVVAVHANVTRRQGAAAVIDAALDGWGRVDILVNVVGGMKGPHERAI
jgi:NAD(P)-dependent dehydrogenase (short-subunit alcohol dehydrogenase family)